MIGVYIRRQNELLVGYVIVAIRALLLFDPIVRRYEMIGAAVFVPPTSKRMDTL